jgi:hypothetical protein
MANEEHLQTLRQGVRFWNQWYDANYGVSVDLRDADLHGLNLIGAKLFGANFRGANLAGTLLMDAKLRNATFRGANLHRAILSNADLALATFRGVDLSLTNLSSADLNAANLRKANVSGACLYGANLTWADLTGANLSGADLQNAVLVETTVDDADFTGCRVYGISIWNLKGKPKTQSDLIVTPSGEAAITVDNLKVAQFIYLLAHNAEIRDVIDTITSKVVLILGRFTPERKAVLDAAREALRQRNYSPVLFDFDKPRSQTTLETITLLARMARFVIADITDAKSVLMELQAIVPNSPSLPVQPLLLSSQREPGMFDSFRPFPWFLPTYEYENPDELIRLIEARVIDPLETRVTELRGSRAKG